MKPVKIGIITSGGDVPGLNAALHAIVLTASKRNVSVTGIHDGFEGLIDGRFVELNFAMVRNLMHEGGTILQTSRSARFLLARFRKQAYAQLKRAEIDGLIIIGGNGSLQGADVFARQFNYPIIGVPKTIDNDVFGTDYAIGFDTAINTVVEAVDKIKDTADSTSRTFIVEVMGRTCGSLALHSGIAVAANVVIIPEIKPDIKKLLACIEHNQHAGNRSMIIIVTENTLAGGSNGLKKKIDARYPQLDCRVTILGHIQRGGSPTAYDRNLASLLGYHAATALLNGRKGLMAGSINGKVKFTPLSQIAGKAHAINTSMMDMANQFSLLI